MGGANLSFGGGVASTVLHPAVLFAVVIAAVLMWALPRTKILIPFLAAGILIPMDQVVVIGPAHFSMLRLLVLAGLLRIFTLKATSRLQIFSGGISKLDLAVVFLTITSGITGVLLWQDSGMVIYQLGEMYTIIGLYAILRFLIREQADVERAVRVLACIAIGIAVLMLYEQMTGWNPYALLGGARSWAYDKVMERDGRFRAMGYLSPIPAGTSEQ